MKDLYLKVASVEALKAQLLASGAIAEGEAFDAPYFQNKDFFIDYIGKLPKTTDPVTGEVTEWFDNDRFNVRLINESCTAFDSFERTNPETPYRVFS